MEEDSRGIGDPKKSHQGKGGKRKQVGGGGEWGEKKIKMNPYLTNGWECWLIVSRSAVSSPVICQKCFGLVAKGNLEENSLLKYLNAFPKPLLLFF